MVNSNVNENLFQQIKDLHLLLGEYALFGSAPMGIRNLKVCNDIDIIVTNKLWNELKAKGWEQKIATSGSPVLHKNKIEAFMDWPGYSNIDELISRSEIIDGLPFVQLDDVVKWKKQRASEKDVRDIEIINKWINSHEK